MTMIATDELTDGQLIELPHEAGDTNQPRFEPVDEWLRSAAPAAQKTAIWRCGTRSWSPQPHDGEGNYFFGTKEPPVLADAVLRERFSHVVPQQVLDELIAGLQAKAGNLWTEVVPDKLSS